MAAQEARVTLAELAQNASGLLVDLAPCNTEQPESNILREPVWVQPDYIKLLARLIKPQINTEDIERYAEDMSRIGVVQGKTDLDLGYYTAWATLMGTPRPEYRLFDRVSGPQVSISLTGNSPEDLTCQAIRLDMQIMHPGRTSWDGKEYRALTAPLIGEESWKPPEKVAAQIVALNGIITAARQAVTMAQYQS